MTDKRDCGGTNWIERGGLILTFWIGAFLYFKPSIETLGLIMMVCSAVVGLFWIGDSIERWTKR